jgi:lambda family phage tail tape measure protein
MDIASLGIRIDTTDAAQASSDLDKLTAAGGRAESSVKGLAESADKLQKSSRGSSLSLKDQAREADESTAAFRRLYGGTTAAAAGMFSLENSIKNGSFVRSLAATQDADRWLASLTSTTKKAGSAFLDSSQKLTYLSSGLKGLGAWSGSSAPVFGSIAKGSKEAVSGLGAFGTATVQSEMSAKALQNALRGVPAQFTDIAVSLQGGQAPLTVLLQQGGQLKDMFGGVGPAAKALGGYVLGLVNPLSVAAAAVATLGLAYYQGSEERDAYRDALVTTGNAAGTTTTALAGMAKQVSATVGTTGAAAAVLAQLAGSGKIVSSSFEEIAIAALAFEKATGKAASETVAEFAKLADDPVKAVVALNDKYNFLTAAVFTQIRALQDQGDTLGAQQLAESSYADALVERAGTITNNLGAVETAWNYVKGAAKGAWDAILDIGREDTFNEKMEKLETRLKNLRTAQSGPIVFDDNPDLGQLAGGEKAVQSDITTALQKEVDDQAKARQQMFDALNIREGAKAYEAIQKSLESTESKSKKLTRALQDNQREIAEARKAGFKITAEQEAALEKQTRDKFKESKKGGSTAVDLTGFNDAQNQLKMLTAAYGNSQKELDAQQKAGLISLETYAAQRATLIRAEKEEVGSAYQAEIAALEAARAKSTTSGAQRIQIDQKIADARTSMVKAQQDADTQLEVLANAETGRIEKQRLAISTYTDALNQQNAALQRAGQRAAGGVGQGDRQASLTGSLNGIEDRANQQRLDLARDKADKSRNMSAEEYQAKLEAINRSEKDLAETTLSNYEQMSAAQSDWRNGATSAFSNYLESARDVAGQTKSLFTNAFTGMEDALVNFALTGKASFADFAKSILADMARIATRQASSSILSSIATTAIGSYFGGNGTATSAGSTQAGYTGTDLSNFTPVASAKGNVFDAPGLSSYSNSIVSSPTLFPFAKGTGLMGEAGPEAIMPLTRTSNGTLGVRSLGGSSDSGGVSVSISIASDGQTSVSSNQSGLESFGAEIGKFVEQKYKQLEAKSLGSQGNIRKAINGRA